jgi:hypothetical protein
MRPGKPQTTDPPFFICVDGPGVPQTRKRPSLWRSSRTQQARRLPSHSREFLFDPQPRAKQVWICRAGPSPLLDHLIGSYKQGLGDREAQRLSGL